MEVLESDVAKLFAMSLHGLLARHPLLVLPWFCEPPPSRTTSASPKGPTSAGGGKPLQRASSAPPSEFSRALAPSLKMQAAVGASDDGKERRKAGRKMQKQRKLSLSAAFALQKQRKERELSERGRRDDAWAAKRAKSAEGHFVARPQPGRPQGPPGGEGFVQVLARFFAVIFCAPIALDASDDARFLYLFGRETAFFRQLRIPIGAFSGAEKRALGALFLVPPEPRNEALHAAIDRVFLGVALCRAALHSVTPAPQEVPCTWQRAVLEAALRAVAAKKEHLRCPCRALCAWLREDAPTGFPRKNDLRAELWREQARTATEYMLLHGMFYWDP